MLINAILLLSTGGFAQNDPGWAPSRMPATQIAKKVDAQLGSLQGVFSSVNVQMSLSSGKGVAGPLLSYLKDKKTYNVTYLNFKDLRPASLSFRANGTKRIVLDPRSAPVGKASSGTAYSFTKKIYTESPLVLYKNWNVLMTKAPFGPTLEGYPSFSNLLKGAAQSKAQVSVLEKMFQTAGQAPQKFYEIRLMGKDGSRINLRFHATIFLPVQMAWLKDKQGLEWQGEWRANQKFQPDLFKVN